MPFLNITSIPGFAEWRLAARHCLQQGIPPHDIIWNPQQTSFFETELTPQSCAATITVPTLFMSLAEFAVCHQNPERFALLYRILWRLVHENPKLLDFQTDDDVLSLNMLIKAVRRDAYKIKAFVRFRETRDVDGERFVCWYEPEHYTLELTLSFFKTRFANMRWSILTPYRAAHWDTQKLVLSDSPDPALYPDRDHVEGYWLDYYASIFNPGRLKKKAMLAQMPKKYWKNLPESVLIDDLIRTSGQRVQEMIKNQSSV